MASRRLLRRHFLPFPEPGQCAFQVPSQPAQALTFIRCDGPRIGFELIQNLQIQPTCIAHEFGVSCVLCKLVGFLGRIDRNFTTRKGDKGQLFLPE